MTFLYVLLPNYIQRSLLKIDLHSLVEMVKDGDSQIQYQATLAIRKLLSQGNEFPPFLSYSFLTIADQNPPIQQIIETGVTNWLVQFLKRADFPELQVFIPSLSLFLTAILSLFSMKQLGPSRISLQALLNKLVWLLKMVQLKHSEIFCSPRTKISENKPFGPWEI